MPVWSIHSCSSRPQRWPQRGLNEASLPPQPNRDAWRWTRACPLSSNSFLQVLNRSLRLVSLSPTYPHRDSSIVLLQGVQAVQPILCHCRQSERSLSTRSFCKLLICKLLRASFYTWRILRFLSRAYSFWGIHTIERRWFPVVMTERPAE